MPAPFTWNDKSVPFTRNQGRIYPFAREPRLVPRSACTSSRRQNLTPLLLACSQFILLPVVVQFRVVANWRIVTNGSAVALYTEFSLLSLALQVVSQSACLALYLVYVRCYCFVSGLYDDLPSPLTLLTKRSTLLVSEVEK